jgi:hypothetical protein
MNVVFKGSVTVSLLGVLAFALVTPSEARYGRWAAAGAGVAAGAAIAGAGYYRPGYAYRSGYDAYGSGYDAYASGGSVYTTPGAYYQYDTSGCGTQGNYGVSVDRSACNQ